MNQNPDDLTRPERAAEYKLARKVAKKIRKSGGCAFCIFRIEGFGLVACSMFGRSFPLCMYASTAPTFTRDTKVRS